jgi:hypothetical protein
MAKNRDGVKTIECSLAELQAELYGVVKDQLSNDEEVLICYANQARISFFGLAPTKHLEALVVTGRKVIKVTYYDTGVNYVESMYLSDIVSIQEGFDSTYNAVAATVLGHGSSKIELHFESQEIARKFTNVLRRAIDRARQETKGAADRLRELAQLQKEGLISEDELQQKRKEIIEQL